MKQLEQKTDDWHSWRLKGIGSSDAPVIMQASEYKTPFQLWEEKTGRVQTDKNPDFIQQKGHGCEPIARAQFELIHDYDMPPALVEHSVYPYMRASLDARNKEHRRCGEIKYVGKEDFENALKGIIRVDHQWQMVHQLMVTGDDVNDYICATDDEKSARPNAYKTCHIEFKRDLELEKRLQAEEIRFQNFIETDTPPPLSNMDFLVVNDPDVVKTAELFREAKLRAEAAAVEMDVLKNILCEETKRRGHPRMKCQGVRVIQITRAGNVNYKTVPQLKDVDLEKYRGKSTTYYQVSVAD